MGAVLGVWLVAPGAAASSGAVGELQPVLDAAAPGATVRLEAGVWRGPVTIDQPVTLLGEEGAVIDGGRSSSVVTVAAPDVELGHLWIRGSGRDLVGAPSGILIERAGTRAYVHDVRITDSYLGVTVRRAPDVRLERLAITGSGIISGELHAVDAEGEGAGDGSGTRLRGDGIWLYDAVDPAVRDCRIADVRDGVYVSYGRGSTIDGTTIAGSRYAVHAMYADGLVIRDSVLRANLSGVVAMYGGPVLVERDLITESGSPSTGFGVLVKDAADVVVRASTIADNRVGLHIDDAGRTNGAATLVEESTIAMNQVGVLLAPSADPTFTGNAFVENSTQVALAGTGRTQAIWGRDGVGNHWSDYAGFDADGDGVGDLPYTHGGRTSRLIAGDPILLALSSGPAFRLLTAVEDRWAPGDPVARDDAPRMHAPASIAVVRGSPAVPLWAPGALLLAGSVAALVLGRRRGVRTA
jgi:nitrous oxidase accessory protein